MDTSLEHQLPILRRLDLLRRRSVELRSNGIRSISTGYKERKGWDPPGDFVEKSLLLRSLSDDSDTPTKLSAELKSLESYDPNKFFESGAFENPPSDRVPVLRAAVVLEALVTQPGSVFTQGAFGAFFRIVYSLYAAKPTELMGGARSGGSGIPQTAFITWRCVRSILSFANAFAATAKLVEHLGQMELQVQDNVPHEWTRIDKTFKELLAKVEAKKLKGSLLVKIPPESEIVPTDISENIANTLRQITEVTLVDLVKVKEKLSKDDEGGDQVERQLAINFALDKAAQAQKALKEALIDGSKEPANFKALSSALRKISLIIQQTLDPAESYLRSVLNRELVSEIMEPQRVPDAAEMVFAAAGLELLDPNDHAPYRAALDKVAFLMTDTGRIPSHKPFDVAEKGYVLHVVGVEIFWAFTELAYRIKYNLKVETAERILKHFSDNWNDNQQGWTHERAQTGNCSWWLSALAVDALLSYRRMLDQRINQIIFDDLSVRYPKNLKVRLETLFYPDYGLVAANLRDQSVGVELLRMLAHVSNVKLKTTDNLYSAVFYGPPGTGKTTLAEAIAASANIPLVEITPSDILLGGQEKIETRARVVFEALAMLSEVVIILDEFDRVLWDRSQAGQSDTIFQFLTPGMLPKLKKLHDDAKEQRTVFILSTNLIGGLDSAAIREGRFDIKIGVYPPDALSRQGRLLTVWSKMRVAAGCSETAPEGFLLRFKEVVAKSGGLGMNTLGKPGWFTSPGNGNPKVGTPLHYLLNGDQKPVWPAPEKEIPLNPSQDYPSSAGSGKKSFSSFPNSFSKKEWNEWKFIEALDKLVSDNPDKDINLDQIIQRFKNARITVRYSDLSKIDHSKWSTFIRSHIKLSTKDANERK